MCRRCVNKNKRLDAPVLALGTCEKARFKELKNPQHYS